MSNIIEMLITNSAPLPIAVQSNFAQNPILSGYLCHNQELTVETWNTLWDQKQPADEASALVSRPLSEDQFVKVLRTEKRVKVIERMFDVNHPTIAHLPLLENLKLSPAISASLIDIFGDDLTVMATIGPRLSPTHRLEWVTNSSADELSDDEVFTYVTTITDWWGKTKDYRKRGLGLKAILVERPQLVSRLAQHGCHEWVRTALAGSKDLITLEDQRTLLRDIMAEPAVAEFSLAAFLYNPKAHQEILDAIAASGIANTAGDVAGRRRSNHGTITSPLSEVTDLGDLVWLVRRSIPSHGEKYAPGKLGEMLDLALNESLTLEMADDLASGLKETEEYPYLPYRIRSAQQALATRFPRVGMKYGFIDDPDDAFVPQEEHAVRRDNRDTYEYADRLPRETNAFAAIEWGNTNYAPLLTEILGEEPGVWISFLAILKDHAKESTLADLAKTARRINA